MAIAVLTIDMVAKLANLERDMGKAAHIAEKNAAKMDKAFAGVAKGLAAIGATLTVGAFAGMVRGVADAGDELAKLSTRTGAAVEELSKLQYAASLSDTSNEELGNSLTRLNRLMGEAAQGSKEATDAIARFDIKPGTNVLDAFKQIADRVKATGDETKIASALNDVFGRSFQTLIPLLKGGADGLRQAGDELERMGGVMSGELATASEKFNDNLTKISTSLDALKIDSLSGVVQGLETMTSRMISAADAAGGLAKGLGLWLSVGGDDESAPGKAAAKIEEKLVILRKQRDDLMKPGIANAWANIGPFGDLSVTEKQIATLEKELKYLESLRKKATGESTYFGQGGQSAAAIGVGILDVHKSTKPQKAARGAAKKEEPYTDELTTTAENYARAIEQITAGKDAAAKSTLTLNAAESTLFDLMRSPYWDAMPGPWQDVVLAETKAASAAIKVYEEQKKLNDLLIDTPSYKMDELRDKVVLLADAFNAGRISAQQLDEATQAALGNLPQEVQKATDAMASFADEAARNMQNAFADFLFDPFKDGVGGMLQSFGTMLQKMIAQAVAADLAKKIFGKSGGGEGDGLIGAGLNALTSFFANADGGVYASPGLSAYSGSVVSKPTLFPFANGVGLMGEAGAEAILPLKRGANGKLGVSTDGGSGGGNTIIVHVNGNQSAPDVRRAAGQGAREALNAINGARRYS